MMNTCTSSGVPRIALTYTAAARCSNGNRSTRTSAMTAASASPSSIDATAKSSV